ncbi:hypothetical protein COOONC_03982 [Cooperia oncophora]
MAAVKGCFGHAGHGLDLYPMNNNNTKDASRRCSHMLCSMPSRSSLLFYVGVKINKNMLDNTINYIIQPVRREHRKKASRLFFVSINDLWDLTKKYKIRPGCRNSVDITSVTKRVEEENPYDGILIVTPLQLKQLLAYSSRGISLDDSRHNTRYNIKLATLMVADEKDRGLSPFLLSNTMTTDNVSNLFKVIKELMPDFNPRRIV